MTTTYIDYGNIWVCTDCYFAHHYGAKQVDREPTDDEMHAWKGGYLRGHDLPNMVYDEATDSLVVREWFAGDTDIPCSQEPLTEIPDDLEVSDNTCADHSVEIIYDEDGDSTYDTTACEYCGQTGHEDGLDDFSWRRCDGCGSTLGGSRSRLHLSKRETT